MDVVDAGVDGVDGVVVVVVVVVAAAAADDDDADDDDDDDGHHGSHDSHGNHGVCDDHNEVAYRICIPSRKLTYLQQMAFRRWFSFSQGGIC